MSFTLTKNHVAALIPNNSAEWHILLAEFLPKYEINTALRTAAFIAQCSHESAGFTRLKENLNYSARGLNLTFPKYFVNAGRSATAYSRQPEKIANIVYAGRLGNGNTASGDGWRFIGRGIIQLTGRANYTAFADAINMSVTDVIKYLETKRGALHSACWYWKMNNLNPLADTQDIVSMTKRINGGTKGLEARKILFNRAKQVLI